jgi:uncharacterized membrane protein
MKTKEFLALIDEARVIEAVRAAEQRTSGEVRVFVSCHALRGRPADVQAREEFRRLEMISTRGRNAVLFYVVPSDQAFAVVGDEAVHAKCGQTFWAELAKAMEEDFARGDFTGGLVAGIGRAGVLLAEHFPRAGDDRNELPDGIARDR